MASLNTKLYASQENGGKASVSIQDVATLVGEASTIPAATTATEGVVLQSTAVADCVPAADGTSAGTQLNALLAALRTAGIVSAT